MAGCRILVVDDEKGMRDFLEIMLKGDGFDVDVVEDGRDALDLLEKQFYDVVITDVKMPDVGGLEVLRKAKEVSPETAVLMITAFASTETAVEAMKQGAIDYITKPFKVEEIRVILKKALERRNLERENAFLKKELGRHSSFSEMIGESPAMQRIYELIRRIADIPTNVLVTGESGTGKELVAKAIHFTSSRGNAPFVTIHCGAIPENLIESELFGHMKGSFTGAITTKAGLFEMANGGTVFLDEIGEVPLCVQVKLLRFLQDRTFRRVGGTEDLCVNVRVICATNRDLEEEVAEGRFREDLYYRLNVIRIRVPPLRERKEDIPLLADHFVKKYGKELHRAVHKISKEALRILEAYDFPGNIRELENIIERAVVLESSPVVTPESLPAELLGSSVGRGGPHKSAFSVDVRLPQEGIALERFVEDVEKQLICQALERTSGMKKKAARLLNVSFRSLRYRLEKYGIDGFSRHAEEPQGH